MTKGRFLPIAAIALALAGGVSVGGSIPDAHAQGSRHQMSPVSPPPAGEVLAMPSAPSALDTYYDQYLAWKEDFQNEYNIEYSLQASVLPQWGVPKSGSAGVDFVWSPSIIWKPFSETAVGSGAFTVAVQQNQFWNGPNTVTFQSRAGLLTPPGDWIINTTDYAQLTYTHTLPGEWRWLSLTIGQYGFAAYDANQYAGNAQTNFINYALAQNATQTYVSADLGAYAQAVAPNRNLVFAGGFQGATNLTGALPRTQGLASGKEAYFLAGQWTPSLLEGGSYGLLWYAQPAVSEQLSSSRGLSFNAVQNIDPSWGLFLRANSATGTVAPIRTSVAWGAINNDPFKHNPMDQIGFGVAWNKTNFSAVEGPAHKAEWVAELYYNYTVFKGLQITPDVQLYLNPALTPSSGPEAVFTLRATVTF
jgi:porin